MIVQTELITLQELPTRNTYGVYNEDDIISTNYDAQVVFQKNKDNSIPDNTERINIQFKCNFDFLDVQQYRVIRQGRKYRIEQVRRSAVIQPDVVKLQCSLIRE